jgi:hypothetical protein
MMYEGANDSDLDLLTPGDTPRRDVDRETSNFNSRLNGKIFKASIIQFISLLQEQNYSKSKPCWQKAKCTKLLKKFYSKFHLKTES